MDTPPVTAREPADIETIFQAHHALVLRAAYRVTGNTNDAEDVLQSVFLRLIRRGNEAPAVENVEAYLHRSAVNAALDVVRHRQEARNVPLEAHEAHLAGAAETRPDRQQEQQEMRDLVRRAIAQLAPRAAEIFALHYFEGHANPEIARMLDLSPAGVAVTLHRARTRIEEEIRSFMGGAR